MSDLQQAFLDHDGFQCGYCTPGQISSAHAMLQEHARGDLSMVSFEGTREEVVDADRNGIDRTRKSESGWQATFAAAGRMPT